MKNAHWHTTTRTYSWAEVQETEKQAVKKNVLTFERYRVEVADREVGLVIPVFLCWSDIQKELRSLIFKSRMFG